MDARGARGFASATAEAQIEVADRVVVEFEVAFGERLHQINAAARRIHLGARDDVGRARLEAEPAMNAVEQQLVVNHVANGLGGTGGKLGHQSAPTKHPGLKMFAGSKVPFSRFISLNTPGFGRSKNSICGRIDAGADMTCR